MRSNPSQDSPRFSKFDPPTIERKPAVKLNASIRFHIDKAGDTLDLDEVCLEVAKDVIAETGGKKDALIEVIAELVAPSARTQINNARSHATVEFVNPEPAAPKNGESARFARRISTFERFLSERLNTPEGYKRMRDCTVDDLVFAVGEREAHIRSVQYHVNRLNEFVDAMRAHGAATLGELPESALAGVLSPVAA